MAEFPFQVDVPRPAREFISQGIVAIKLDVLTFLCSGSALLFNGNPLLRYDGYYVLSDLLQVPNLSQQSRALVRRFVAGHLLGMPLEEDRSLPEGRRGLVAAYAVASTLYRWAVVAAILWLCHRVLEPRGLALVAWLLVALVLAGMLVVPAVQGLAVLPNPAWRGQIRRSQRDLAELTLTAPADGTVLPPPRSPAAAYQPGRLPAWSGNPLEPRNRGCYLETGTLFCLVGHPDRLEAVLVVDQADWPFVQPGQRVRVRCDQLPGHVLEGTVRETAESRLSVLPAEVARANRVPARTAADRSAVPRQACLLARVELDPHPDTLRVGALGRAKILAAPQPLLHRLWRYLRRTFTAP